jgi:hypothetical protein
LLIFVENYRFETAKVKIPTDSVRLFRNNRGNSSIFVQNIDIGFSDYIPTAPMLCLTFRFCFFKSKLLRRGGILPVYSLVFLYGKILTGLLYTFIMVRYIPAAAADIDLFYGDGLIMYETFWQNPAGFPAYLAEIFSITDLSIGHTDSDFIRTVFDGIKFIHFLLDFLSGGHLYTNVLLFNGLATWLFLRCWVYLRQFLGHWWMGGWIFLFPSAFFFTSVVLKEGIELCLIAAILPLIINGIKAFNIGRLLLLLLLTGLLFFFKYLIAATFFASLGLYWFYNKFPSRKALITGVASILFMVMFFGAYKIHTSLDLPQYIINRRLEFQTLEANSALQMRPLYPTLVSFVAALPETLNHVLFKPLPGEGGKMTYLVFSAEMLIFWGMIGFLIVWATKKGFAAPGPEAWAFLLFAIINLLIIGYTITNIGAITRYRSIFMPGIGYFFWVLCKGPVFMGKWRPFSQLSRN